MNERPLKAKKLRYYQDRNFTERVLPAPTEPALPIGRRHDWAGQPIRPSHSQRADTPEAAAADEGGLARDHSPSLDGPEPQTPMQSPEPDLGPASEDFDDGSENRPKPAQRALGLDQADRDLLPDF